MGTNAPFGAYPRLSTDSNGNTVLVGAGVEYPLIKIKRATFVSSGTAIATGASVTPLPITSSVEDVHGLIDLINGYINVPSDAIAYKISSQGFFAANATGVDRTFVCEGWTAGAVWIGYVDCKAIPHASISPTMVLGAGALGINPALITRLRLAAKQDSGGNLTFTPSSTTIEFICE